MISGNKQANVAVYSKLNSEGKSEKNVQAIYVDEDGLSEAAEIPVRVITKDGDFDVMLQIAQQYIHFPENILQRITVNISRVM